MNRFVSNFTSRLDAKGRVSIPASFRAVLRLDGFDGLYAHSSLDQPALDCGGNALITEIDALTADFPAFSPERDQVAMALMGTSEILRIDPEGRIVLPEALKAFAKIGGAAAFVGLGRKFQIWEPVRFAAHLAQAREKVRDMKQRLHGSSPGNGVSG